MDLHDVSISYLMTEFVETIDIDESVGYTLLSMINHRFRRFPVVEDKRVVGIITSTDILKAIHDANSIQILEQDVEDVMSKDLVTGLVDHSLMEILTIMAEKEVSCLPLLKEGELKGLFTNKDLMLFNLFWRELPPVQVTHDNPMIHPFNEELCIEEDAKISVAIQKILDSGTKDLVLRDREHNHIGWITTQRVLRSIATTLIRNGFEIDYLGKKIISRIVTDPIIDIELPAQLSEIVSRMNKRRLESVPLTHQDEFVAVITEKIVTDLAITQLRS